ncbi:hypothetical protein EON67_07245, partial [archaeon]
MEHGRALACTPIPVRSVCTPHDCSCPCMVRAMRAPARPRTHARTTLEEGRGVQANRSRGYSECLYPRSHTLTHNTAPRTASTVVRAELVRLRNALSSFRCARVDPRAATMLRSASFHPRAVLCVPLPAPHVRCVYTPHPLSTVSTVDAYHSLLSASCRPIFPVHNICALPRPPQLLLSPHFVAPPLCTQPLPGALRAPLSVRSVHTISNCAGGAHCADQRPHSDARAEPHRSTPSATPAQEGTREERGSKKSVKTRPSTRPMRGKSKAKWYAVARGREVGVFLTWEECSRMVTGFAGAMFKSFPSIDEAKAYVALHNRGSGASAGVGSIAGSGARVDGAHIAAASALHALRASAIASDLAVTHTSGSAPVHPPHHNSHALAAAHLAPSLQPATAG